MARTIFRRKRSAVMTKTASWSFSMRHSAVVMLQILVLTSVCVRQKDEKSCVPIR